MKNYTIKLIKTIEQMKGWTKEVDVNNCCVMWEVNTMP